MAGEGLLLSAYQRLIRFVRMTALIADAWTILYIFLLFGWQITQFTRGGQWPALQLKAIVYNEQGVMQTAEIARGIRSRLFAKHD